MDEQSGESKVEVLDAEIDVSQEQWQDPGCGKHAAIMGVWAETPAGPGAQPLVAQGSKPPEAESLVAHPRPMEGYRWTHFSVSAN